MSDSFETLTVILQDDLEKTTDLIQLLEEEKQLLENREFLKLSDLASSKEKLISAIQSNNDRKVTILSPLANNSEPSKLVDALVAQYGLEKTQNLKDLNQRLEKNLAQCRHLNAVNGQVIIRNLENNKELISIVTGQNQASDLYNSMGKVATTSGVSSQHFKKV